jgi:hypothetical protein
MATRVRLAAVLAAFSWMVVACASSLSVGATYDSGADFSTYQTFAFSTDLQLDDTYRQKLAERTIADILSPKGFRYDPANPDLLIGLSPFAFPEIKGDNVPAGTVAWGSWGTVVGADISTGGSSSVAAEVTLTFQDARTKHLLWRGTAEGRADLGNPQKTSDRVVRALKLMLAGFPPEKK